MNNNESTIQLIFKVIAFWILVFIIFFVGYCAGILFYRNLVLDKYREYQKKENKVTFDYPEYLSSNADEADGQFYVDYYDGTNAILDDCDYEEIAIVEEVESAEVAELEITDEIELMARCVEAEAGNQGLLGKQLVADVILNRVESDEFPDSITEVIKQKYQFSTWSNGMIDRAEPTDETYEAIKTELVEVQHSDIIYFTAHEYGKYGTPAFQEGDHYFCTK